jgi:hypothetical protein
LKITAIIKLALQYSSIAYQPKDTSILWIATTNGKINTISAKEIVEKGKMNSHSYFFTQGLASFDNALASGRIDTERKMGSIFIGYKDKILARVLKSIHKSLLNKFPGTKFFIWGTDQKGNGVDFDKFIHYKSRKNLRKTKRNLMHVGI